MVFTHATRVRVPDGESFFIFIPLLPKLTKKASGGRVGCSTSVSRLAQLVERKTLNLVVVGSSPTVGVHFFFFFSLRNKKLSAKSSFAPKEWD